MIINYCGVMHLTNGENVYFFKYPRWFLPGNKHTKIVASKKSKKYCLMTVNNCWTSMMKIITFPVHSHRKTFHIDI